MSHRTKLAHLSISLGIGVLFCLIVLVSGFGAISAFVQGHHVEGVVSDRATSRYQYQSVDGSTANHVLEKVFVNYQVDGQPFSLQINGHVYAAMGWLDEGVPVTVSYDIDEPKRAYVMEYGLFNTLSSLLWPFAVLIFIVIPPQWYFHFRKAKQENISQS